MKTLSTLLTLLLLSIGISTSTQAAAIPEDRSGSRGEKWSTISASRLGPQEYSANVVGTPVVIKKGTSVKAVHFMMQVIPQGQPWETALTNGLYRVGLSTRAGLIANPIQANVIGSGAVTVQSGKVTGATNNNIRFYHVRVELTGTWTAEEDQEVYVWANVEFTHRNFLIALFQYGSQTGGAIEVDQNHTVRELGYNAQIWLEGTAPAPLSLSIVPISDAPGLSRIVVQNAPAFSVLQFAQTLDPDAFWFDLMPLEGAGTHEIVWPMEGDGLFFRVMVPPL